MSAEVSRYLARVAYVTRADTAMRARLAALEDLDSIDDLPAWVPRAPAAVLAGFRQPRQP